MPRDQVRVAIYVRSRGNTHESRTSTQHQRDQLRAVLNAHDGWRLVRTFTDCGSANAVHRPGLAATLVQARAGCFDLTAPRAGGGGQDREPEGHQTDLPATPSGRFLYCPDWWAAVDSNHLPPRYQHGALPVELAARRVWQG